MADVFMCVRLVYGIVEMWVLRTLLLLACVVLCLVCVSVRDYRLGVEGGSAMAGALQHLTSLTVLEYV
jgi:hypothetical protein